MSRTKGSQGAAVELSNGQRKWLAHLKRCEASGETKKEYAKRHRLSVSAMYQAAKDLRQRGALACAVRRSSNDSRVSFVRVSAAAPEVAAWRVRFNSGVVLESSSPLSNESLTALVEALSESQ